MIEEVLISDDIQKLAFSCDLSICKGACCVEGDYGAPLDNEEVETIEKIFPKVRPHISPEAEKKIDDLGTWTYYDEIKKKGTTLMDDGACVFLVKEKGISLCVFEKLFNEGQIDFRKPLSCHLYPIRIEENEQTGFQAVNYDEWEICHGALKKGKRDKIYLYEFAKEGLIRKYGEEFYQQLVETIQELDYRANKR